MNVARNDGAPEAGACVEPCSLRKPIRIAVLGGSSSGMPAFIQALRARQALRRLGPIEVRLFGRDQAKLQRVHSYIEGCLLGNGGSRAELSVSVHVQLREALTGATHIVCLVRPGGMAGRARDEELARALRAPADEGLALGGLACFLRGREVIRELAAQCRRYAPCAVFLQMSSPLGLNVAVTREAFGPAAYGVCELPLVTKQAVLGYVRSRLQRPCVDARCAGLNHQSWLYAFTDAAGCECTADVLSAIDSRELVGVDPAMICNYGAVPMPYLRLFLHTERVLADQLHTPGRGATLAEWSEQLARAFRRSNAGWRAISELLAERKMNWFEHGLAPVIEAFNSDESCLMPLNAPCAGALVDIPASAIVEVDFAISRRGATPVQAPPLPPKPLALTQRLIAYEQAVLQLPQEPSTSDLAEVLSMHPLTPSDGLQLAAHALKEIRADALS